MVSRVVTAAERHPDDGWIADEGPAAQRLILTAWRPLRIYFGTVRVVVHLIPVVHPLPNVSKGVIQSKAVRTLLSHFVNPVAVLLQQLHEACVPFFHGPHAIYPLPPAVVGIPGDVIHRPIADSRTSAARRKFPLRFCGQPPSYPFTVIARLVPGYVDDGHRVVAPPRVERPTGKICLRGHGSGGALCEAFVRPHRNVGLPHPETPADLHR